MVRGGQTVHGGDSIFLGWGAGFDGGTAPSWGIVPPPMLGSPVGEGGIGVEKLALKVSQPPTKLKLSLETATKSIKISLIACFLREKIPG